MSLSEWKKTQIQIFKKDQLNWFLVALLSTTLLVYSVSWGLLKTISCEAHVEGVSIFAKNIIIILKKNVNGTASTTKVEVTPILLGHFFSDPVMANWVV